MLLFTNVLTGGLIQAAFGKTGGNYVVMSIHITLRSVVRPLNISIYCNNVTMLHYMMQNAFLWSVLAKPGLDKGTGHRDRRLPEVGGFRFRASLSLASPFKEGEAVQILADHNGVQVDSLLILCSMNSALSKVDECIVIVCL